MLPFDPLTIGTLLVLASGRDIACQIPKPAQINAWPSTSDLVFDTSQTIAHIQAQDIDTINPYSFGSHSHTNGYMISNIQMNPNVKLDYRQIPGSSYYCIWYDKIELNIHLKPKIVIPKEVAADRCMYQAVKEHEMKHVMVDRKVANKYAKTMGRKIYDGLSGRGFIAGPVFYEDAQEVADRMRSTVVQLIELEYKKMEIELAEQQQAVDTLEEYERVQSQCPNYKSPIAASRSSNSHGHRH